MQWKGSGSTKLNAQGDSGANTSATNQKELIHDYKPFTNPEPLGVFLQEAKNKTILTAKGSGYLFIVSDQGNIMKWQVVYTRNSKGNVPPDNYHQSHRPEIFGFDQSGNNNDIGKIGFFL